MFTARIGARHRCGSCPSLPNCAKRSGEFGATRMSRMCPSVSHREWSASGGRWIPDRPSLLPGYETWVPHTSRSPEGARSAESGVVLHTSRRPAGTAWLVALMLVDEACARVFDSSWCNSRWPNALVQNTTPPDTPISPMPALPKNKHFQMRSETARPEAARLASISGNSPHFASQSAALGLFVAARYTRPPRTRFADRSPGRLALRGVSRARM